MKGMMRAGVECLRRLLLGADRVRSKEGFTQLILQEPAVSPLPPTFRGVRGYLEDFGDRRAHAAAGPPDQQAPRLLRIELEEEPQAERPDHVCQRDLSRDEAQDSRAVPAREPSGKLQETVVVVKVHPV